jgi:hypothetical protein
MTDFNFTVRATDNAGAFADRNFSLTVNDTATSSVVDRFVVLGSGGLARSPDGVTWSGVDTSFASTGFNNLAYGNNTWVAYQSGNNAMRVANGSSMVFAPVYNPAYVIVGTSRTVQFISQIIYRKGMWNMIAVTYLSGQYSFDEFTSTDLKTFTLIRPVYVNYSTNYTHIQGYDYDPVKDTWVIYGAGIIFSRTGSGAWAASGNLSNPAAYPTTGGTVMFKNGLWVVGNVQSQNFATSLDGRNFITRTGPVSTANGSAIAYQNGRLLFSPLITTTGANVAAYESLNGGRTFTQRGTIRTTYPQGYSTGATNRQLIASYAGRTVLITNVTSNAVYTSNDDLTTTTQISGITGLGTPYAIAARDN